MTPEKGKRAILLLNDWVELSNGQWVRRKYLDNPSYKFMTVSLEKAYLIEMKKIKI